MYTKIVFPILFLTAFIYSCTFRQDKEGKTNERAELKKISIPQAGENIIPWESLLEDVTIVKLETTEDSHIGDIQKVISKGPYIYISDLRNLYIFDDSVKFLFKLKSGGKGPGEIFELRDYQVDESNNIQILDFMKIKKFSPEGEFLQEDKFKSLTESSYFNPLHFCISGNSTFFWNGDLYVPNRFSHKDFALYKVNSQQEIDEKFFPILDRTLGGARFYFVKNNNFLISPRINNDTIFKIQNSEIIPYCFVDFGDFSLPENTIPADVQRGDRAKILDQVDESDYCFLIDNLIETNEFIYFTFMQNKSIKNALYSKKSEKTISGKITFQDNIITPHIISSQMDGNRFISVAQPFIFKPHVEKLMKKGVMPKDEKQRKLINAFNNTDYNDNPLLLILKLNDF